MYPKKSIRELPKDLRPREKLSKFGASALSDEELLAVIFGSGTKEEDVISLASKVVSLGWETLMSMDVEELSKKIKGLGFAKACQLKAVIELAKRINDPYGDFKISNPQDAYRFVKEKVLFDERREHLIALYLTPTNKVVDYEVVAIGKMNALYAEPKDIHNHPKGDAKPSKEDIEFTKRLKQACELLGFELLDHIIINQKEFFSLRSNGLL